MARDPGRPENYRPQLQYNLRTKVEGGRLRAPGEIVASPDALSRRECLVLVHGFNNTDGEAARAYLGFRERQAALHPPDDRDAFERLFGDTFWPGDAAWWWVFDKADFLVYPKAVGTAVEAAAQLAAALESMPWLHTVDFVAHSLGCRVVLETVKLLHERSAVRIGRVCLMAAAVPSEFLEYPERYYDLLRDLSASGTLVHVLHSMRDGVLHGAFPWGQALVGEAPDRALGRFGPTPGMPGRGSTLTDCEIAQAGHGDYWGHSGTDASKEATAAAGTFLRLGEAVREIAQARSLVPPSKESDGRSVGESRALPGRRPMS